MLLIVIRLVFILLFLVHKTHTSKLAALHPTKQVGMLYERLKITEEVAKRLPQIRTTFGWALKKMSAAVLAYL
jgi:hypothetical protein